MKLGKSFVNSMVREVGRNYGKAISNRLLGDKHSTPYRRVGANVQSATYAASAPAKKRMSSLERLLNNFTRKTTEKSTLTQALNLYDAYFTEVNEAQAAGGAIDLAEATFLVQKSGEVIRMINSSVEQLKILDKPTNIELLEQKKQEIKDFIAGLDEAMLSHIQERKDLLSNSSKNQQANKSPFLVALFSLVGMGQAYFYGGLQHLHAKTEAGVFALIVLAQLFFKSSENSVLIVNLFTVGYVVYALFISWKPAEKRKKEKAELELQQSLLEDMESQVNAISREIARI
jgi:hypothetical protein